MSNITSGFHATGVYRFNPKAVLYKVSDSRASSNNESPKSVVLFPRLIKKYER